MGEDAKKQEASEKRRVPSPLAWEDVLAVDLARALTAALMVAGLFLLLFRHEPLHHVLGGPESLKAASLDTSAAHAIRNPTDEQSRRIARGRTDTRSPLPVAGAAHDRAGAGSVSLLDALRQKLIEASPWALLAWGLMVLWLIRHWWASRAGLPLCRYGRAKDEGERGRPGRAEVRGCGPATDEGRAGGTQGGSRSLGFLFPVFPLLMELVAGLGTYGLGLYATALGSAGDAVKGPFDELTTWVRALWTNPSWLCAVVIVVVLVLVPIPLLEKRLAAMPRWLDAVATKIGFFARGVTAVGAFLLVPLFALAAFDVTARAAARLVCDERRAASASGGGARCVQCAVDLESKAEARQQPTSGAGRGGGQRSSEPAGVASARFADPAWGEAWDPAGRSAQQLPVSACALAGSDCDGPRIEIAPSIVANSRAEVAVGGGEATCFAATLIGTLFMLLTLGWQPRFSYYLWRWASRVPLDQQWPSSKQWDELLVSQRPAAERLKELAFQERAGLRVRLEGERGTGKTVTAAATIRRLLEEGEVDVRPVVFSAWEHQGAHDPETALLVVATRPWHVQAPWAWMRRPFWMPMLRMLLARSVLAQRLGAARLTVDLRPRGPDVAWREVLRVLLTTLRAGRAGWPGAPRILLVVEDVDRCEPLAAQRYTNLMVRMLEGLPGLILWFAYVSRSLDWKVFGFFTPTLPDLRAAQDTVLASQPIIWGRKRRALPDLAGPAMEALLPASGEGTSGAAQRTSGAGPLAHDVHDGSVDDAIAQLVHVELRRRLWKVLDEESGSGHVSAFRSPTMAKLLRQTQERWMESVVARVSPVVPIGDWLRLLETTQSLPPLVKKLDEGVFEKPDEAQTLGKERSAHEQIHSVADLLALLLWALEVRDETGTAEKRLAWVAGRGPGPTRWREVVAALRRHPGWRALALLGEVARRMGPRETIDVLDRVLDEVERSARFADQNGWWRHRSTRPVDRVRFVAGALAYLIVGVDEMRTVEE